MALRSLLFDALCTSSHLDAATRPVADLRNTFLTMSNFLSPMCYLSSPAKMLHAGQALSVLSAPWASLMLA
jgi:hypothetical protein